MSDDRIPLRIEATAYVRVHIPDDVAEGPAPALMALHGYAQDGEAMFAYAKSVAPAGTIVIAPEGPQAFYAERWRKDVGARRIGYGWIADPDRAAAEARNRDFLGKALDHAAEAHAIDPARTVVLGYSQGVGVAADFAVHARERVGGLIGLAGGVPTANRPALGALEGLPVLWLTGTRDRYYAADYNAKVVERLAASGTDLEAEALDLEHALLDDVAPRVTAWLSARLG